MHFPQSLAVLGLLGSLASADFTIFEVTQVTHYCKTNGGGCIGINGGTTVQPGPPRDLGTDCISDDNPTATTKDGQGLDHVSDDEELWWENGFCGSPAPYYCFVLDGMWTCNDSNGQNVANCTDSSYSGDCTAGFENEEQASGKLNCVGPITC